MAGGLTINVRITGVRDTLRAFRELPKDASAELRDRTMVLAQSLAAVARASGMGDTAQSARAASSVKAVRDRVPVVKAGGTKRSSGVIFGSEFGMNRRSGWYARRRYRGSAGRQYRPHQGAHSYWFFTAIEGEQDRIDRTWNEIADSVIRKWGSG
ncbi:hypothetical protein [Pseudonocardia asaccharolytica]|uniref:HK97 gp10 family phage protein n=1 Tax=Pseudonocardia asaccharolytica DSM 44247 = NBRC 16224 TaxID=1123024 RepID=A0A511CYR0_9PSEU|nr:hypothetical protein [Pseudonocardia asaccharolytica]GEL17692.1 hypothetical protein PA7_15290 [Pseudonocardia asaccharolytica DSM 44247 = NBRC 16224]